MLFFVAFRIPNFFRRIFGEGAIYCLYSGIKIDYKNKDDQKEVKEYYQHIYNDYISDTSYCFGNRGFDLILIYLIAPGFVNSGFGQYDLTVSLLKITFPYMLFICLTAIAGSILNTYDNFAYPAITPVVLNLSLIASVLFAAPYFPKNQFLLLLGAFLLGGVIQLAFQIYPIAKLGLLPKIKFNSQHPGLKKIKEIMLPMIFGSSITQINMIFDTVIASFFTTGSIGWLYMSDRFVELPYIALFGISIATVMLPKLSDYFNRSNIDAYNRTLNWGLKLGILISFQQCLA